MYFSVYSKTIKTPLEYSCERNKALSSKRQSALESPSSIIMKSSAGFWVNQNECILNALLAHEKVQDASKG